MAVCIAITVVPCSSSLRFQVDKNGVVKCYLISQPEDGKANRELIKALSKALKLAKENIEIAVGLTHRKKIIKIHSNLTIEAIYSALGLQYQPKIF